MIELKQICENCHCYFKSLKINNVSGDFCFINSGDVLGDTDSREHFISSKIYIANDSTVIIPSGNELIERVSLYASVGHDGIEKEIKKISLHVCYHGTDNFTPTGCPFKFERDLISE